MGLTEDFVPLTPINFFQLSMDVFPLSGKFPCLNKKNNQKYLLPDTSELCGETSFAKVALGWSLEGIEVYVDVDNPLSISSYPNIQRGDSVELFFDTRDVKTSGFNTKFCHHFFFLPEGVDTYFAGELTHFRTDDKHPLCQPEELKYKTSRQSTGYQLNIFIPNHCLHGYDPEQFTRLGFSYRINRAKGTPQHFSVTTEDYQIEQQPSLWSTLHLKRALQN